MGLTKLCPLCHRAEPLAKTEYTSVSRINSMAVSVTIPESVCGRCGIDIADAALRRAQEKFAEMRGKELRR